MEFIGRIIENAAKVNRIAPTNLEIVVHNQIIIISLTDKHIYTSS
jgi:hypothetical protein